MIGGITIQVLTPEDISSANWADTLLQPLTVPSSCLRPTKIGNYEPVKAKFISPQQPSLIWKNQVIWKTKKPKAEGFITISSPTGAFPSHSGVDLWVLQHEKNQEKTLVSIFKQWSTSSLADIGYIHLLTKTDIERGTLSGEVSVVDQRIPSYSMHWSTRSLRKQLPNIHWGMVFGSPYIDLFGREKLLSAPAHRVWETPSGQIFLQLTSSLFDLEHDYEHVHKTRERVKEHLGADAFYKPRRSTYHAPRFEIQHREVAPAIDPQRALEALKSNLQDRVSAALTTGKLHRPLAARMDKRERVVNHELQQAILLTKTEEDIVTDIERTFKIEALTVSIAGGIARPTSHTVDGRTVSAIQMHLEHESGYCQNLLFTYNQPFDGFKDCISLEPQPYIYERHARKI
ncbi:hypothetical protein G6O69_04390 [Pseudenhygromyxa sp. WMMC2535]|uniref:hypothetical protein n=1 Tax=Pseudenhygromyxa sp. WMMC2535 TaxID=2712867 RepID=UPI0015582956|nr:hypothetical protein [Pseudenhygromyxa sp. WMMC2535]NVB37057.1 hypothetical protein [Pseudenhygromyxa sp. WMMC2535]